MIRHATFALLLVGAAFAGGAAFNGPGLAWLQRSFGGSSIIVDRTPATPATPKQFPTAGDPPIRVNHAPGAPPRPKAAADPALAPTGPVLLPESPSTPPAALIGLTPPDSPLPPMTTEPPQVADRAPDPAPPLELPPVKTDPVARLASITDADPSPNPVPPPARDWGEIRKRLRAAGVARYAIEAETDGRVRFTCVIPVDGLRAVGHHFEADGDDEYQAAEAALKRVALWKATEAK